MFTCVGWQVTLCYPIWQMTSRSSETVFPGRAISGFTFTLPLPTDQHPRVVDQFCRLFKQRTDKIFLISGYHAASSAVHSYTMFISLISLLAFAHIST